LPTLIRVFYIASAMFSNLVDRLNPCAEGTRMGTSQTRVLSLGAWVQPIDLTASPENIRKR
jgi:hypothetical protein